MVIIRHHIGVGEGAGSAFGLSRALAVPLRLPTTRCRPARYVVSTLHSRPAGPDPGLAQAGIGRVVDVTHSSRCGDGLRCLACLKKCFWESYHDLCYGVND